MEALKRRLNYNDNGTTKVLHLETSSDMVERPGGGAVEASLAETETNVENLTTTLDTVQTTVNDNKSLQDQINSESQVNYNLIAERLNACEQALIALRGTGEGSITSVAASLIAERVAGAPESFDTFKELYDWIVSHESSAGDMNSKINTNAGNITTLQTKVNALESAPGVSAREFVFSASNFVNGVYTIPAATHGLANGAFVFQLYRLDGSAYKASTTWGDMETIVSYNADKSITLTATAFNGKLVIIG